MLVKGNSKLGRSIWCWGIPAKGTCPGRTELCDKRCYAQKGFYTMPNVQVALHRNYEASQMSDFVPRMIEDIRKKRAAAVRIHTAGDYYDVPYVRKWHSIVAACPDVRFFTYTRSWRLKEFVQPLNAFANECKNLRMWWSLDAETGYPKSLPASVSTCYMSVHESDMPDQATDLAFRDYPQRKTVLKHMNGVMVCPPENGVTDVTCEQCGYCWRGQRKPKHALPGAKPNRRFALSLAG